MTRRASYAYCVTNCVTTQPDVGTAPRTPTDIASALTCTFLPVPSPCLLLRDEEVDNAHCVAELGSKGVKAPPPAARVAGYADAADSLPLPPARSRPALSTTRPLRS